MTSISNYDKVYKVFRGCKTSLKFENLVHFAWCDLKIIPVAAKEVGIMSDRERLKDFCSNHLNDREVNDLMIQLEPFFEIAEKGTYPLADESEELAGEILSVSRVAFPVKVDRIEFVSIRALHKKPAWMTHKVYDTQLRRALIDSLDDKLGFDPPVPILIDQLFVQSLFLVKESLLYSLWKSLSFSLNHNPEDAKNNPLGNSLRDTILGGIIYFVWFMISHNSEEAAKWKKIVELLTRAIPLGMKCDEKNTALILIA